MFFDMHASVQAIYRLLCPILSGSPVFYTSNLEVTCQIVSIGLGASFVKQYIGVQRFSRKCKVMPFSCSM